MSSENDTEKDWNVYILILTDSNNNFIPKNRSSSSSSAFETYIGATNDIRHRLRAHNAIITSSVRSSTHNRLKPGTVWRFILYIGGFTKTQALSFERLLKTKSATKRQKALSLDFRQSLKKHIQVNAVLSFYQGINNNEWFNNKVFMNKEPNIFHFDLYWWQSTLYPSQSKEWLPIYVTEHIVNPEQQKIILQATPIELQWKILPYNI